ncbi:NUDIX hydrolase [Oryzibacter oryziterrae]|uniref:NUDIX hydrolase n=1 Tax=Oryzibacter oryziterrae TaxID=2766474 RepID=UPI001F24B86F|nr:NUDIX domain-containing protein [Oryzibacter oryziterrae]
MAKRGKRRQVAALAYRITPEGVPLFLLISSRDTRRAVIPKGWPMKGLKDHEAAATEALEEAGVTGKVGRISIGSYLYWKRLSDCFAFVTVDVFPLKVSGSVEGFREEGQREIGWFKAEDAALLVDEPLLATMISHFSNRVGRRRKAA